jgi:hypothetical protein
MTGAPGHGKTYGAVRKIRDALEAGKWVATNVELHDGWAVTMARTNWIRRLIPGRCARMAAAFEERVYTSHDLTELRRLRLPACGKCQGCRNGQRCKRESRGVAVLDEAHNWLNSRTWDADETGQATTKAEAVRRRLDIVRFFSQHRKLGWDVYLITQDEANLDRQVRSLFEYHVHLKNLRRYKLFGLFPIVPVPLFVAVTTWHDNEKSRLGVESFLLNRKLAGCYDTTATSHGLVHDDQDSIWLGGRPAPASGERGSAAQPAPAAATDPAARRPRRPLLHRLRPRPEAHPPGPPAGQQHESAQAREGLDLSGPLVTIPPVTTPYNAESPELTPRSFPTTSRDAGPRDGLSEA